MIQANFEPTFESWRAEARRLLKMDHDPSHVLWSSAAEGNLSFFNESCTGGEMIESSTNATVPAEFLKLARTVSFARDEDRWGLLYRVLFRLKNESRDLLKVTIDEDVRRLMLIEKNVRRDIHKMHAFVRFKRDEFNGQEIYRAWYKPEHRIVRAAAPFFARRFGDRPWSIFTPDESAHWNGETLFYGPGMPSHEFLSTDHVDELWTTYYRSIFNPARLKLKAMRAEMAQKHWGTLPEARLIPELVREAPQRLAKMAREQNERAQIKAGLDWGSLRSEALACRACPLYGHAKQTVFGEGSVRANLMIVGEQPGDQEDQQGRPFVGPAGELLNGVLAELGQPREELYLTNAVKHFKWEASGKLRLHKTASGAEMHACRPWLEEEISRVNPKVILALGRTAGLSLLGRAVKITEERGKIQRLTPNGPFVILSWHPAAILRSFDETEAQQRRAQLAADLALGRALVERALQTETMAQSLSAQS